eukprot:m.152150 g.152150  ORF g.152150 m.152150 type:complete len:948 (+) comp16913_c1_seq2:43-2886(+)
MADGTAQDDWQTRLLPFQQGIFSTLVSEADCLVVLARGLGLERLLVSLLRLYCDPRVLVIVLNVDNLQRTLLMEELSLVGMLEGDSFLPPSFVNSDTSPEERRDMYLRGGVVFATSRCFVLDMLTKRAPAHLLTGIVVCNAHRVTPTCNEAFILRLFRHANREGFIKALTDNAEGFTGNSNAIDRVLKTLWLRKLFFVPRFHVDVMSSLPKLEMVEHKVALTPNMMQIQTAISTIMSTLIGELKKARPEIQDVTFERGLFASFDVLLRRQLDPVWHTLSHRVKDMVFDLRTMRDLSVSLEQTDAVSFYQYLQSLKLSQSQSPSPWMLSDASDELFLHARHRVFKKKEKANSETTVDLEMHPKWAVLRRVLLEVDEDLVKKGFLGERASILIVCSSSQTCAQLEEFLQFGADFVLKRKLKRYELFRQRANAVSSGLAAQQPRYSSSRSGPTAGVKRRESGSPITVAGAAGAVSAASSASQGGSQQKQQGGNAVPQTTSMDRRGRRKQLQQMLTDQQMGEDENLGIDDEEDVAEVEVVNADPVAAFDACFRPLGQGTITLHAHASGDGALFARVLRDVCPSVVILYDPHLACLREIEVFKSSRPGQPLRLYFLMYDASLQEQRYLSSIRYEKQAFEYLIAFKGGAAIQTDQDGRNGLRQQYEEMAFLAPGQELKESTRLAGGRAQERTVKPQVIVDLREFRSSLPMLVHERSIALEPRTLVVGDYVISPNMCVERKSLTDLVGSLASGRLYNQCVAMSRFYKTPILLLEFDEQKAFSLLGSADALSGEVEFRNTMSKLVLLVQGFPQLRLLWSRGPYATAEMFAELKKHQPEPDADHAATIGLDDEGIQRNSCIILSHFVSPAQIRSSRTPTTIRQVHKLFCDVCRASTARTSASSWRTFPTSRRWRSSALRSSRRLSAPSTGSCCTTSSTTRPEASKLFELMVFCEVL